MSPAREGNPPVSSRYAGRHRGGSSNGRRRIPRSFRSGFVLPTAAAATLVLTATGASVAKSAPIGLDLTGAEARAKAQSAAAERSEAAEQRQQMELKLASTRARVAEQQRASRDQARAALVKKQKAAAATKAAAAKKAAAQKAAKAKALAAAEAADHIVLTLGITPDLEGESMSVTAEGFKGGDKLTLDLPATQRELLAKVSALKKPTVVVLTTGSAINLDDSQAGAVLLAWYYGQRGADAVAEALLGETNPAGRLPITFYRNLDGLPAFDDYAMTNRTYRYHTGKPLYAFGHGLSYTTFAHEKIALSPDRIRTTDTLSVSVTVKNTGRRDGDEVVQLYATATEPPVPMPLRQLVAFERVRLRAGETKTVAFSVPAGRLRRWDEAADRYVVDPGAWRLDAGPASDRLPLRAVLTVTR